MKFIFFTLSAFILLAACTQQSGDGLEATLKEIAVPCKPGSSTPYLTTGPSDEVYLSWQEPIDSVQTALKFSVLHQLQWSQPRTIATGTKWFVNWADFPMITQGPQGMMVSNFLKMSDQGNYDYDIHLALSKDHGVTWERPFILHDDGISAEHGFVSMQAIPHKGVQIAWLDGRQTKTLDPASHHSGPMSLRTALLEPSGTISHELALDRMVCDCCQTDVALTSQGPLVVYRNRSEDDVRDIAGVRFEEGQWHAMDLPADGWKIQGCPVNGPRVDARGNDVVLVWFTAAATAKVQWSFSTDGGATFSEAVTIDQGRPMGRVDVALLPDKTSIVSWLEAKTQGAEIMAIRLDPTGNTLSTHTIASSQQSRGSGFPRMTSAGYDIYWAWTDQNENTIRTANLKLDST